MRAPDSRGLRRLLRLSLTGIVFMTAVSCTATHTAAHVVRSLQPVVRAGPYSLALAHSTPAQLGCAKAAQVLGYAIPCPVWLPEVALQAGASCLGTLVSPAWMPGCSGQREWSGWMIASGGGAISGNGVTVAGNQHFVMEAAPFATTNYDLLANGPVWYALGRPHTVQALGWVTAGGRRMRFVMVPQNTQGSAMAGHLALAWTAGSRTYAITFHVLAPGGEPMARALDLAVAQRLVMIWPPSPATHASVKAGG
ncbi:MAG: hypothetical protein M3Z75_24615 [Actinomycetota bacterium]|nr:hypothetical protein [Actinomycetota bacterium]